MTDIVKVVRKPTVLGTAAYKSLTVIERLSLGKLQFLEMKGHFKRGCVCIEVFISENSMQNSFN